MTQRYPMALPLMLTAALTGGCNQTAAGPAPPQAPTVQVHDSPVITARIVATPAMVKPGQTVTLHIAAKPEAEYKRWAYDIDWTATDRHGNCMGKFTVGPKDVAMTEGEARTFRAADVKWTAPKRPCVVYIHASPCIQSDGDHASRRPVSLVLRIGNARYERARLTPAKAIALAASYCDRLITAGLRARKLDRSDPTAEFPTPALSGLPPNYRSSTWSIEFRDGTEVCVADGDGRVTSYTDLAQMESGNGKPGAPMPRDRALAKARKVVELTGFSLETGTLDGRSNQMTYPPTSAGLSWNLRAPRLFRQASGAPLPYADDDVAVGLSGQKGYLEVMGINFRLPAPRPGPAKITAEQALKTARSTLGKKGVLKEVQREIKPRLVVSAPTTFWQDGNPEPRWDRSNVTWECAFSAPRWFATVEVDAATGKVVGGELARFRGGRGQPAPAPRR